MSTPPTPTARTSFRNRILILRYHRIGHLPPAQNAAELLVEKGHQVSVLQYGNPSTASKRKYTFDVVNFRHWWKHPPKKMRGLIFLLEVFVHLCQRFLVSDRPSLIIAHGLQEQALAYGLSLLFRIPYTVHVHEVYDRTDVRSLNRFLLKIEKYALRRAHFLVFPEKTRSEIYKGRYRLKCPIYIAYNCPRLRKRQTSKPNFDVRTQYGLDPDAVLMVYVGGIAKSSGIEQAICALQSNPKVHFFLLGWCDSNYLQYLKTLAQRMNVDSRVFFLGELSQEKWDYLEACDISYCIYFPEQLRRRYQATASNKLMESFAAGTPVLTLDRPDFRQIVDQHGVGVCVAEPSVQAISEGIRTLAENPDLRRQMGERARKCHEGQFNYETQFFAVLAEFPASTFTDSP